MVEIWLEEIFPVDIEQTVMNYAEFLEICCGQEGFVYIDNKEFNELSDNHPIRRISKEVFVKDYKGKLTRYHVYISKTLNQCKQLIEGDDYLFNKLMDIWQVDNFNIIRDLVLKGYFDYSILEGYNSNCYFYVN